MAAKMAHFLCFLSYTRQKTSGLISEMSNFCFVQEKLKIVMLNLNGNCLTHSLMSNLSVFFSELVYDIFRNLCDLKYGLELSNLKPEELKVLFNS
jgi:hypothetical protein